MSIPTSRVYVFATVLFNTVVIFLLILSFIEFLVLFTSLLIIFFALFFAFVIVCFAFFLYFNIAFVKEIPGYNKKYNSITWCPVYLYAY
jgi:hypothetical protein